MKHLFLRLVGQFARAIEADREIGLRTGVGSWTFWGVLALIPIIAILISPAVLIVYLASKYPSGSLLKFLLILYVVIFFASIPILAIMGIKRWNRRKKLVKKFEAKRFKRTVN